MEIGDGLSFSTPPLLLLLLSHTYETHTYLPSTQQQQQQRQQQQLNPPPLSSFSPRPSLPPSSGRSSIRVSRSENSSVLVGAPNEPEIRSEPRVWNGRYGAQLTLKYHRCGPVRDPVYDTVRVSGGGASKEKQGSGLSRQGTKGPANFMDS